MTPLPDPLVLFDGVCGFCDHVVQWLLRHDTAGKLRYAPLQGPTAAAVRARFPEVPVSIDTVVFVDEGRVYMKSRAFVQLVRHLPAPWSWLGVIRVLPRFLTDFGYDRFAAVRYRIFGQRETCRIPRAEERARFLA